MHGQPVWSYLYRKVIPHLTAAGLRVIAPDLVGYGKSDKPAAREDYSYERQVEWMGQWLEQNDFSGITFFGQDWGGLIGLRLVVNHPQRFDRVVISNTGLPYNPDVPEAVVKEIEDFRANAPTPSLVEMQGALSRMDDGNPARKFAYWQKFCWETEDLPIGFMMSMMIERQAKPVQALKFLLHRAGVKSPLPTPLAKAYEAPFPDPSYKMGPPRHAEPSAYPADFALPGRPAQGLGVFRDLRQALSMRLRRQRFPSPAAGKRSFARKCRAPRGCPTPPSRVAGISCRRTRRSRWRKPSLT